MDLSPLDYPIMDTFGKPRVSHLVETVHRIRQGLEVVFSFQICKSIGCRQDDPSGDYKRVSEPEKFVTKEHASKSVWTGECRPPD